MGLRRGRPAIGRPLLSFLPPAVAPGNSPLLPPFYGGPKLKRRKEAGRRAGGAEHPQEIESLLGGEARRFTAPDGCLILVGRSDRQNDHLTFHLARPADYWLHVAGASGAHVILRCPPGQDRPSREAVDAAADLAAYYSELRHGGRVAVHLARRSDVWKPRGAPSGRVALRKYRVVYGRPGRVARARTVNDV